MWSPAVPILWSTFSSTNRCSVSLCHWNEDVLDFHYDTLDALVILHSPLLSGKCQVLKMFRKAVYFTSRSSNEYSSWLTTYSPPPPIQEKQCWAPTKHSLVCRAFGAQAMPLADADMDCGPGMPISFHREGRIPLFHDGPCAEIEMSESIPSLTWSIVKHCWCHWEA